MKILIAVAPEKFRDEELAGPVAAFKDAGYDFDIASTRRGTCRGMMGATVTASLSFEDVEPKPYDGLVIIGGAGAPEHLWDDEILIHLAKFFNGSGKLVAAICLSPVVLAHAGILYGKKATVFATPDSLREMKKAHAVLEENPVVVDGMIITANGPAASKAFGEAIVKALASRPW